MTKSLHFILPLKIYPFDIMISFGESDDVVENTLKKYKFLQEDEKRDAIFLGRTTLARTIMFTTNQTLIRLKCYPKSPKDYGDLQHEIFHAVTFIMDRIGMKLIVLKSDEAYAYLCGYITTEIYNRIK